VIVAVVMIVMPVVIIVVITVVVVVVSAIVAVVVSGMIAVVSVVIRRCVVGVPGRTAVVMRERYRFFVMWGDAVVAEPRCLLPIGIFAGRCSG